jgi:hypothetical protein
VNLGTERAVAFHRLVRLFRSFNHRVGIRTEKTFAVEVDNVVGIFGNPDLRFPGNLA